MYRLVLAVSTKLHPKQFYAWNPWQIIWFMIHLHCTLTTCWRPWSNKYTYKTLAASIAEINRVSIRWFCTGCSWKWLLYIPLCKASWWIWVLWKGVQVVVLSLTFSIIYSFSPRPDISHRHMVLQCGIGRQCSLPCYEDSWGHSNST